jgi:hypothetical protein
VRNPDGDVSAASVRIKAGTKVGSDGVHLQPAETAGFEDRLTMWREPKYLNLCISISLAGWYGDQHRELNGGDDRLLQGRYSAEAQSPGSIPMKDSKG